MSNAEQPAAGPRYRPNVAAILMDVEGRVLICERADIDGCWQFPQGGVETGDTPEETLPRELYEELALRVEDYQIVEKRGPYRYLFPTGITKRGFQGQEQYYFLLRLLGPRERVDIEHAPDHEFQAVRWIHPAEYSLQWAAPMKKEVYRQVFKDFFGLDVS